MNKTNVIVSPNDPGLDHLCDALVRQGGELDRSERWPAEQLRLCGDAGVYQWFMPRTWGGQQWSDADITRGYLRLGAACLTTAFIITQRTGACQRIAGSENEAAKRRLLPKLVSGETFATVGISHLTTSRRHLRRPCPYGPSGLRRLSAERLLPLGHRRQPCRNDRHRRRA